VTRLIIASTPYHALLATAGLAVDPGTSNHLVIINDFQAARPMAAAFKASERALYQSVSVVGGTFGLTSRARRQFRYRGALGEMRALTRNIAPAEIWVGNDARPECQAAFSTASRPADRVTGVYIEDGLTAYASSVKRPLKRWENAVGYVMFGRFWSGISVLGTSRWISKGLFIYPALVRHELSHLSHVPIAADALLTDEMRRLAAEMVRLAGADSVTISRLEAIVTVSHSSVAAKLPQYRDAIARLVAKLIESGRTVGVKYHPRQAEPDYLGLTGSNRVVLLPQGLPLEYLYLLTAPSSPGASGVAGGNLQVVVGDVSTTLLTARWLVPRARCVSLARPLGLLDASLEGLFTAVGVQLPESLEFSG